MQSNDLTRRILASVAVLGLTVGIGACSSDDDDQARTESNALGDGTQSSGADENVTTTTAADTSAADASDADASGDVPQESDLDIDVRHQSGTQLTVRHIAFPDDSIVVDLDIHNGASRTVQLHDASSDQRSLRLVDDAGNVYSFRPPEDMENPDKILLEQGETLSGTWEFLGPLVGHPTRLHLVTMLDGSDIENVDPGRELGDDPDDDTIMSGCIDTQYICPSLAIPIDLTWA